MRCLQYCFVTSDARRDAIDGKGWGRGVARGGGAGEQSERSLAGFPVLLPSRKVDLITCAGYT